MAAAYLLGDEELPQERAAHGHVLRVLGLWGAVWLVPVALVLALLGPGDVFAQIALFFSQMAMVTFGGAYAVLAYVAQQAVDHYGWLKPGEMLDGLGMAETTPGPLIMVTQFVGFMAAYRHGGAIGSLHPMLAGTLGGLLTTWVTFTPCFLWIFLGAPYVEVLRGNRSLNAALSAITAAVVGVILNLTVWFALHVLFGTVTEVQAGPLRWYAFDPLALDLQVTALAVLAAVLAFVLHRGLVELVLVMAALGVALRLVLPV
jgi:chromate transporter